jgi:hypothetical protein
VLRPLSLILVALLGVSLIPAALGATHASSQAQAKKMTITILSRTRIYIPHDLAPRGTENKGDWIRYRARLLTVGPLFGRRNKNQPIGWEAGTQTFVSAVDARIRGTTTFPGHGTIKFKGLMRSLRNGMISVPVIGGTGKFNGAKGVLLIGAGNLESVNTYHLRIPDTGSI